MLTNEAETKRIRRTVALFLVALSLGLIVLWWHLNPPGTHAVPEKAHHTTREIGPPPMARNRSDRPKQGTAVVRRIHSIQDATSRIDKAAVLELVVATPKRYLDRAKTGDAEAAMALYYTVSNCRIFRSADLNEERILREKRELTSEDCFTIPKTEARTPQHWLRAAAEAGRSDAQVIFALETGARLNALSRQGIEPDEQLLRDGAQAVSYLESGAREGVREAYQQLAMSYQYGYYGRRDPVLAFAYLSALKQLDPRFTDETLLDQFARHLRPADVLAAQSATARILSECCKG